MSVASKKERCVLEHFNHPLMVLIREYEGYSETTRYVPDLLDHIVKIGSSSGSYTWHYCPTQESSYLINLLIMSVFRVICPLYDCNVTPFQPGSEMMEESFNFDDMESLEWQHEATWKEGEMDIIVTNVVLFSR